MNHDEHIRQEVERSLRQASDRQLARVMGFIDRLPSRRIVEDIVERVRSRLALVRPSRPLTYARVLFLPLQDLLAEPAQAAGNPWLVPRPMLEVIRAVVRRGLSPPLAAAVTAIPPDRTMDDVETVSRLGEVLWPAAAAALRDFLQHGGAPVPGWQEDYRKRLDGVAQLYEHAIDITALLEQLPPRPMGILTGEQETVALALLYSMRHVSDAVFRSCYTMLMRRTTEPSQIFRIMIDNDLDLPTDQRDRMLAEAAVECLNEIDSMNTDVGNLGAHSVQSAADTTVRLVSLIESLENAPAAVKLDAKTLSATKARASKTIVRTFENSLSGEMRRTVGDLAARTDATDEEVATAEAVARSTRKIEMAGERLGLARHLEGVLDREFGAYRTLLLDKLRQSRVGRRGGAGVSVIMDELRLIEILFGAEAAMAIIEEAGGGVG